MTPLQIIDLLLAALAALFIVTEMARRWSRAQASPPIGGCSPSAPARWGAEAIVGPVLGFLTGYGLVMTAAGAVGMPERNLLVQLLAGSGAHILGAIVCLWIVSTQYEGGIARFLTGIPGSWRGENARRGAGVLLIALGLCPLVLWATVNVLSPYLPDIGTQVHPTIELLHKPDTPFATIALLWLAAVVIAPAAEELFFRGILQNTLRRWYGHPRWAIAAASAVFAFVHAGQPAVLPAIYMLSVLLGYLYERNANILAPVLIHAIFNARTMLWETLS